jgi:acetamidase/formamidase
MPALDTGQTHLVESRHFWYTYGPNEPAVTVSAGDRVVAETCDAHGFDAQRQPLPDQLKQSSGDTSYRENNPLTGPVYVCDAAPGDVLAVRIEEIALTRRYAWSRFLPNFGAFTGEGPGRLMLLNDPLPEMLFEWDLDLEREVGRLQLKHSALRQVEIPLHPFIGSIGVAPAFGRVEMALTPGEYGGNMDCPQVCAGATLYLPVWVRGAYLVFGDIHAAQGDGEICGVALETTARVTLQLDLIKTNGQGIRWPRLEDAEHIMVIGSARPLMDCVRIAHFELVEWLVADFGFDRWEAFELLSQVGSMRVGNVVDPNYSVVARFPKRYLPPTPRQ